MPSVFFRSSEVGHRSHSSSNAVATAEKNLLQHEMLLLLLTQLSSTIESQNGRNLAVEMLQATCDMLWPVLFQWRRSSLGWSSAPQNPILIALQTERGTR